VADVRHHQAEFTDAEAGMRLDQALAQLFTEYSRTAIKQWIEAGQVTVNSSACRPRYCVRSGDSVRFSATLDASNDLIPEPVAFDVMHLDDACLVVNKPPGCVVHPGAGNPRATLANGLVHRYPELAALPRAGLIHRLDKNTSGLLVIARNSHAYQHLTRQMAARSIKRIYDALAIGKFISGGTIDAEIGRDPLNRTRMRVRAGGRSAVTHFRIASKFRAHTHLQVELETGRTHQIRVHLAHIKHPIVGDSRYGARLLLPVDPSPALERCMRSFSRQALHARRLEFDHPQHGERITVNAPMPQDMAELIDACRADSAAASI
jgi:23S rRNA pseudouridine1911/1915/1917 synthase